MTWYAQRGSKYGAKTQEYGGRKYHSKKEARYAQELDLRLKAGELIEVIPQFKVDIRVYDKHICNYYVDFKLIYKDGSEELVEVKGFQTDVWKLKWRLLEAIYNEEYPGTKLTVVY